MNLSGKHFEFDGVSSSNPLGDNSVSLVFAHINTEMISQPFGSPEYSSVYSGALGRRVLSGTNRNDSCFEFEQEIISEKGGIPLNKLRTIEQWLFSREAFAKLYIAESEEDPEDVMYGGGKKRLYLNCIFTESEMLTYAEGKVGWKVKILCDAPWAWQDEVTLTCYSSGNNWRNPKMLTSDELDTIDWEDYEYKTASGYASLASKSEYISAGYPVLYAASEATPKVSINSDINDYIYPDLVQIISTSSPQDNKVSMTNSTDSATRTSEFTFASGTSFPVTINIRNDGTIVNGSSENIFPYMTGRKFPRLVSSFVSGSIGLNGTNTLSLHGVNTISFTFKNRRFLA